MSALSGFRGWNLLSSFITKHLSGLCPGFLGWSFETLGISKMMGVSLLSMVSPWDHTRVYANEVIHSEALGTVGIGGVTVLGRQPCD